MTLEFSSIPLGLQIFFRDDFRIDNIGKIVFYIFRWRIQPDLKLYLYIFLYFTAILNTSGQMPNNAILILSKHERAWLRCSIL
jgi:hypothetical protein